MIVAWTLNKSLVDPAKTSETDDTGSSPTLIVNTFWPVAVPLSASTVNVTVIWVTWEAASTAPVATSIATLSEE